MSTLLHRIDDMRPVTEPFDADWSATALTAIMAEPVRRNRKSEARTRRPRRRSVSLAAVATVIGVMAIPTVMTSGGASARAELLQLAVVAADSDDPVITPGTFLHVKTESLQNNSSILSDGHVLDTNRESWIRWDGASWAVDTRPSVGWTEYHRFAAPEDVGFGTPSPEFIAALPGNVADLREYLDRTVAGSNSHNEALFVAISDLANSRMLDPKTLAVALEVLADVDGVGTEDVVVDGRPALEVRFESNFGLGFLGRSSFTVDRDTAQLLRVSESSLDSNYTSTTRVIEVVDEIPPTLLPEFEKSDNGTRICSDGREALDTTDPGNVCPRRE